MTLLFAILCGSIVMHLAAAWVIWKLWAYSIKVWNYAYDAGFEYGRAVQLEANLKQLQNLHASVVSTRESVLFRRAQEHKA